MAGVEERKSGLQRPFFEEEQEEAGSEPRLIFAGQEKEQAMHVLHLLRSCWNDWSFAVTAVIGVLVIAAAGLAAAGAEEKKKRETKPDRNT